MTLKYILPTRQVRFMKWYSKRHQMFFWFVFFRTYLFDNHFCVQLNNEIIFMYIGFLPCTQANRSESLTSDVVEFYQARKLYTVSLYT